MSYRDLAKRAYEAYQSAKLAAGAIPEYEVIDTSPTWEKLPETEKGAWIEVIKATAFLREDTNADLRV